MLLESAPRHRNPWNNSNNINDGVTTTMAAAATAGSTMLLVFAISPQESNGCGPQRLVTKLFRRALAPSFRGSEAI